MNSKIETTVKTAQTEAPSTIHAESLCSGCGALGCKPKTLEDLWFAEQDHKLVEQLKKKGCDKH